MYTCDCGEIYYYITDTFLYSIGEYNNKERYWDSLYLGGYIRYSITWDEWLGWNIGEPCIRCYKPLPERED